MPKISNLFLSRVVRVHRNGFENRFWLWLHLDSLRFGGRDLHARASNLHEGELGFGGGFFDHGRDKLGDGGDRFDGCGCDRGF